MVPVLALLLAARQGPAPVLPPSTSAEVSQTCLAVERALASGDFSLAKTQAALLPKRSFVIEWDDSAVSPSMKTTFAQVRDGAIASWRVNGLRTTLGKEGDVSIRFTDHLPADSLGLPIGSQIEFGADRRLRVTIGLKRGVPYESINPPELFMDVAHAIGAYLGLADDPLIGSPMHQDNHPILKPKVPSTANVSLATTILSISDQLRKDAEQGRKLTAGEPTMELSPGFLDAGSVLQGTKIPIQFKVSNRGTAVLTYNLVPDCGCFSRVMPGEVNPGETVALECTIDTTVWEGTQHKGLVLYTNDPHRPAVPIPVAFTSRPAYRFYRPEGDTVIVPKEGCTIDVLLTLPKDSHMTPAHYEVSSPVAAKVTMEPWSGIATDDDMGEPAAPRQGYRLRVKVPGELPIGRTSLTLSVQTDDPKFSTLQYDLYLQKGIVALPDSIPLGDMSPNQKSGFRVSRHGKPFQVLGVDSGNPFLVATVKPVRGQMEYQVDLSYKGGAPKGDFLSVVSVHTNDPKQPHVEVSVSGIVR